MNDNNQSGHVNLLDVANPRVGRGRVAGTGLPEFESILFGYASADLSTLDAPIGSIALLTDGLIALKNAAGTGNWTLVGGGAAGLAPAPLTQTANVLTNVTYATTPTDLFGGSTITVPYTGTWDLVFSGMQQVDGQFTGGTVTSVNVGSFSVNGDAPTFGTARSFVVPWQPAITNAVNTTWNASFYTETRVTLNAGDTVGVKFGILLLPSGTLTAGFTGNANTGQTRLKIVPVSVG